MNNTTPARTRAGDLCRHAESTFRQARSQGWGLLPMSEAMTSTVAEQVMLDLLDAIQARFTALARSAGDEQTAESLDHLLQEIQVVFEETYDWSP